LTDAGGVRHAGDRTNASARQSVIRIVRRGAARADPLRDEAARVLRVCNDCRRCIDNCAVFPAAASRQAFARSDLDHLANLCHHCGACFQSCPYVPPHASGINVPRTLAQLRTQTHAELAWPRAAAKLMATPGRSALIALVASALLLTAVALAQSRATADGFYAVLPHGAMVALFGTAFGFAAIALTVSAWRFGRTIGIAAPGFAPLALALRNALTLRYLEGNGNCRVTDSNDARTVPSLRALHHLMFYGMALCFASTCVAALYHASGRIAPHPVDSWPVLLGGVGGIGVVVGTAGLLWLKRRHDYRLIDPAQQGLDRVLLALLLGSSATGLVLPALRTAPLMPALLIVHLACVLALVVTAPGGRMVHAPFRMLALLKFAQDQRNHAR
jgi:citrate/tricarballylate utilization protein